MQGSNDWTTIFGERLYVQQLYIEYHHNNNNSLEAEQFLLVWNLGTTNTLFNGQVI